jgi:hypothetical protein
MLNFIGGLTVVIEAGRDVSYSEVESAFNDEAFLAGYRIDRGERPGGGTLLTISVHVSASAITADGVPPLGAVRTLRAVADALSKIDAPTQL